MFVLLFFIYTALLVLAITRIRFFIGSEIKPVILILFFLIHVAAGMLHNWIAYHYFPNHGDIWFFFDQSIIAKHELITNPKQFAKDFFPEMSQFNLLKTNSFWRFLEYELLFYVNMVLDFFSFNNFYINTLLFSLFSFWGNVALFRFFRSAYNNSLVCALCAFFIPSALFWTSCIHKEALLYLSISFLCYYTYQIIKNNISAKKILLCLFFLLLIFLCRINLLFILLPSFFIWLVAEKSSLKKSGILILSLIIVGVFLFLPGLFGERFNVFRGIADKQNEFQNLDANSRIYLPKLEPTAKSFFSVFPVAFVNGFFEPFIGKGGKALYLCFSTELLLLWMIVLYSIITVKKNKYRWANFNYGSLMFCFLGMLLIGYSVPSIGAIVRYRSIFLPFLITPFLYLMNDKPNILRLNYWLEKQIMR